MCWKNFEVTICIVHAKSLFVISFGTPVSPFGSPMSPLEITVIMHALASSPLHVINFVILFHFIYLFPPGLVPRKKLVYPVGPV